MIMTPEYLKDIENQLKARHLLHYECVTLIAKAQQLLEENAKLTKERDEARNAHDDLLDRACDAFALEPGCHKNTNRCPTYYDGCHCTVETLIHNIKRAEKAEAELAILRKQSITDKITEQNCG